MRIFLFDVDGTLLRGDGAGRRAMERAIADVLGDGVGRGAASPFEGVRFDGATDRALVRAALKALSRVPVDVERAIDEVLARYVDALRDELLRGASLRALEGAAAAAGALAALGPVGLGTGNVELAAHMKVGAVGMAHLFAFGGYGSDAERRSDLLAIGAARGAALAGRAPADCEVIVIGDTPRDVEAGHAIGARVIGVATGSFTVDELGAAGADVVLASLADRAALVEVVAAGGRWAGARG